MKIKYLLPLAICALFNMLVSIQSVKAQNPVAAGQGESILTGSAQKSEEIAAKADVVVFIGKIIELGDPVPASTDTASYSGVQVKVLQVLRGTVDGDVVKVTLRTTWGRNVHESPPVVGSTYIFFARKNTEKGWNPYTVLKLLPATDATTAKVKALIAAAPASK
jgi:hypothetical protein